MAFNDVTSKPKLVKICQVIQKLKSGGMLVAFSTHVQTFFCQEEKRLINFKKWKKKGGGVYRHVETIEGICCEQEGISEVTKPICQQCYVNTQTCYVSLHLPIFRISFDKRFLAKQHHFCSCFCLHKFIDVVNNLSAQNIKISNLFYTEFVASYVTEKPQRGKYF
jgi:hypothetical protein